MGTIGPCKMAFIFYCCTKLYLNIYCCLKQQKSSITFYTLWIKDQVRAYQRIFVSTMFGVFAVKFEGYVLKLL